MKQIEIAEQIIKVAFDGKTDKGGKPYVEHLYRVKNSLKNSRPTLSEDFYIAALLHDLVEDCEEWNLKSLSGIFSDRVVKILDSLTRRNGEVYEDYITRLAENSDAVLIKLIDLKDNMDITRLPPIGEKDFERLKKYQLAYAHLSGCK